MKMKGKQGKMSALGHARHPADYKISKMDGRWRGRFCPSDTAKPANGKKQTADPGRGGRGSPTTDEHIRRILLKQQEMLL